MNYEDRVKQITGELCQQEIDRKFGNGVWESKDMTPSNREAMYKHFSFAARIAVAKMAEAYVEGLKFGVKGMNHVPNFIDAMLIQYGLIPGKTKKTA